MARLEPTLDVFTASLRSACSLRRGHFVNNLNHSLVILVIHE
ncbi:putative exported protein [Yersinia pestis PY-66]|nr:putative exported protein [Yersinia pestis PY-66]